MSPSQAIQTLTNGGFAPTKPIPTDGGWQTFKHPDKSKIDIDWKDGRVVRSEAPIYGPDGRKINGGQRLDSSGRRIPRALDHSEHPTETIDISQP